MTETPEAAAASRAVRPPLLTPPLLLRFVSVLGASASFHLLLSVVPGYATPAGGGGAAGLATGALMLATVAGEFATPALVDRYGYRAVLAVGLGLLGVPALALPLSRDLGWIVAVCLLRGLGYGFTLVAGGALTASLIPAERRGEGLALVGIVGGVPALVALPLGVWLAAHSGYGLVFASGGAFALAALASVPGLPDRVRASGRAVGIGIGEGLRSAGLRRPAVVFAFAAMVSGIVVTFLPLAVRGAATGSVAVALFVQPAAATAGRWVAGRVGDRRGSAGLVLPGLLLSAAGTLLMVATAEPVVVVVAAGVFGTGFGILQNATLTLMYARVPTAGYGTVSAVWNIAYDVGMGVGAVAFGWLAAATGYPWAFALTGVAVLTAVVPAHRDRRPRSTTAATGP
ncbi:Major Facilitator Superfamily protein [Streptomyces lavendulae subsp. lavendulae]|uniref:Major Facilitator Superfamily protein n=1 Tax=Streptomyces lavendulae subsp. lavendulae TaxID=58340 RepID=A0A2K8PQL1_STRLA|nr:MFS transporter [Streptomyces lavendulae]ATZ28999.1 Major Facilitator Superfamily protein [Streptomyces lavendulae subsp. lavendulae]QUQ58820.1 putative MFS-type transporter YfcJ [Streptomyces lavendulae subsp. lavendulae]